MTKVIGASTAVQSITRCISLESCTLLTEVKLSMSMSSPNWWDTINCAAEHDFIIARGAMSIYWYSELAPKQS